MLVAAALVLACPFLPASPHHGFEPPRAAACALNEAPLDDIALLLPDSSVAVLRASSLRELAGALETFTDRGAEPLDEILARWGAGSGEPTRRIVEQLDLDRPAGLAVALGSGNSPVWIVVVPAIDAAALAAQLPHRWEWLQVRTAGGYVVISSDELEAPAGLSRVAASALGSHDLQLHVDVARLRAVFGPLLEIGLDQAEAQLDARSESDPAAELVLEQLDDARSLLRDADGFDAHLDAVEGRLAIGAELTLRDGKWAAQRFGERSFDLHALSRWLDPQAAFAAISAGDASVQVRHREALAAALADVADGRLRPLLDLYERALNLVDAHASGGCVANLGLGVDGVEGALYVQSEDPARLLAELRELFAAPEWSEVGMAFSGPHEFTAGGLNWKQYSASVDLRAMASRLAGDAIAASAPEFDEAQRSLEALLGRGGARVSLASAPGVACICIGGDEAKIIEAAQRTARPRPAFGRGLIEALTAADGAAAAFVAHCDFGLWLEQIDRFAAAIGEPIDLPASLAGQRLPISAHAAVLPTSLRLGVSVDARELARFVEAASGDR